MKKILVLFLLFCIVGAYYVFLREPYKPKIYDCFLFFNEEELLEIRLNELYPHVDKFVIVEATETFRGKTKPLFFAERRAKFEKFADKIIYIPVTEHFETENPWRREHFQREQIFQGLKGCNKKDIILISDLDEIVRGSRVKDIVALISSGKVEAAVCMQRMSCGYLNRTQADWPGTVATTYGKIKKMSAKLTRNLRNMLPKHLRKAHLQKMQRISDAGWHFNSIGGVERFLTKIEAFSHSELDNPRYKQRENLEKTLKSYPLVKIDETFPQFVQDNLTYFEEIGFIDTGN